MQSIEAADILVRKIRNDCPDDVSVVVLIGSWLYGEAHARSDLDLYFVPKTERGRRLGFTFMIDGIGFDFWPISWERLERIANHEERITSILTEGRVIHSASDADTARFNQLRAHALDTGDIGTFLEKASGKLDEAYPELCRLLESDRLSEARTAAVRLVGVLAEALALLNRRPIRRGRGKLKSEVQAMPLVPEGFPELYDVVFRSREAFEIRLAGDTLFRNTQALLAGERRIPAGSPPLAESLSGFFEELVNLYNKIDRAVAVGDPVTALYASVELAFEIEQALDGTGLSPESLPLPDLAEAYDPEDLSGLHRAAHRHRQVFEGFLEEQGVRIRTFGDFRELEAFLAGL